MSNDPLKREVLFKSDLLDERTLKGVIKGVSLNGNRLSKRFRVPG